MHDKRRIGNLIYILSSSVAFVLIAFLFWAQSIRLDERYGSDLWNHISRALANGGTGYSLEGKIVNIFDRLFNGSTIGFVCFLSFIVTVTPLAVAVLLSEIDRMDIDGAMGDIRNRFIGFWSIFAAPLVIPYVWFWFYKNTMNINAWHNSTSMEMRLFAVLAFAFYLRIQSEIGKGGI